ITPMSTGQRKWKRVMPGLVSSANLGGASVAMSKSKFVYRINFLLKEYFLVMIATCHLR
ncbi:hypothetical protein L9F63_026229, partial [Diploptera punctata]